MSLQLFTAQQQQQHHVPQAVIMERWHINPVGIWAVKGAAPFRQKGNTVPKATDFPIKLGQKGN